MRKIINPKLERGRLVIGPMRSERGELCGAFKLVGPYGELAVISSGTGEMCESWEHVSVSTKDRTPSWDEMCFIKNLFWREDETVIQYHPAKSDYVNHHPYCLHMWRPLDAVIPLPPAWMVGPKETTDT